MQGISDVERAAFLTDLAALTHHHRISIGGCGCCGSPFLMHEDRDYHGGYYKSGRAPDNDSDENVQFVFAKDSKE